MLVNGHTNRTKDKCGRGEMYRWMNGVTIEYIIKDYIMGSIGVVSIVDKI